MNFSDIWITDTCNTRLILSAVYCFKYPEKYLTPFLIKFHSMIVIENIHKKFEGNKVLRGVDLTIKDGETIAIIGPSGCGKSVLLKHIVGLMYPDEGRVTVDSHNLNELSSKELYEVRRMFGFLFQGAALFDSMTVAENIGLPLVESDNGFSSADIKEVVGEKLELVGLPGTEELKPSELSGGMKKRVGLARALATNPKYILYDEPTTGLDPVMSDSIDELIRSLSDKLAVTSIVVTHDMLSVKNVADKVSMMHEGRIHFTGTPTEIIESEDRILRDFIKRTGA